MNVHNIHTHILVGVVKCVTWIVKFYSLVPRKQNKRVKKPKYERNMWLLQCSECNESLR
jgi:hypothetical protein